MRIFQHLRQSHQAFLIFFVFFSELRPYIYVHVYDTFLSPFSPHTKSMRIRVENMQKFILLFAITLFEAKYLVNKIFQILVVKQEI